MVFVGLGWVKNRGDGFGDESREDSIDVTLVVVSKNVDFHTYTQLRSNCFFRLNNVCTI